MGGDRDQTGIRTPLRTGHPQGSLNTASFRGEVWIRLVLKPQTNLRGELLTRADELLPDPPRWELCDHAALLWSKMAWFKPEGTSPPPNLLPSELHLQFDILQNQPIKASPNKAVCVRHCHLVEIWSNARWAVKGPHCFPMRPEWHSRSQHEMSPFWDRWCRNSTPQSRRGRRMNVSQPPGLLPSSVCNWSTAT